MKNSEKSAYPLPPDRDHGHPYRNGLSKREYFAGIALQSMDLTKYQEICGAHVFESMALDAVRLADALLQKLEETQS